MTCRRRGCLDAKEGRNPAASHRDNDRDNHSARPSSGGGDLRPRVSRRSRCLPSGAAVMATRTLNPGIWPRSRPVPRWLTKGDDNCPITHSLQPHTGEQCGRATGRRLKRNPERLLGHPAHPDRDPSEEPAVHYILPVMVPWRNSRKPRQRSALVPAAFIDSCLPTRAVKAPSADGWTRF